ncbi:Acid beta-fructofuranosidase [Hibiscus syriacus]|uniref:Acid beta-fructofuranosidase n=1 Tax=Hibiscus syriacus TaxID=106335 RepID=A0A6A3BCV0_HIBSY|nr:Acid beta-fructofuranosidase [Hibiscus syriacus]
MAGCLLYVVLRHGNLASDPNGPLFYKGWYHFFYQYNPHAAVWGDIVWGHAVSKDLIHWLHLPLAMVADRTFDKNGVWTGSATILPDGKIVMLYTGSDVDAVQKLDGELRAVDGTGMWECVDFFPVSTMRENGLDTSVNSPDVKHVLKVSLDDDRNDYYAIGTYHEKNAAFIPDDPENDVGIGLRYDYGVYYAAKTFYDQNKNRRVLWGWIKESDSEAADMQKGWASVQSIPRTILLDQKTGTHLLQWPVEEIESLRLNSYEFNQVTFQAGSVVPLDVGPATQLDIIAEFEIDKEALDKATGYNLTFSCSSSGGAVKRGALGPFGLLVLADDSLSEQTPVYFYIAKGPDGNLKTFFCNDQSRSSEASDVNKQIYGSVVPVLEGENLSLRVLVDHSVIESFVQGGRTVITSRVYPTKAIYGAARLFLFNNATEAGVSASLRIWQMNSAFIRPYPDLDNKPL